MSPPRPASSQVEAVARLFHMGLEDQPPAMPLTNPLSGESLHLQVLLQQLLTSRQLVDMRVRGVVCAYWLMPSLH